MTKKKSGKKFVWVISISVLLLLIVLFVIGINITGSALRIEGEATNIPNVTNIPNIGTKTNVASRLSGDVFETYSKVEICLLPYIEPAFIQNPQNIYPCKGISDIESDSFSLIEFGNRGYVPFGIDYATKETRPSTIRAGDFLSFNIYWKQFEQGSLRHIQYEVLSPPWLICSGENVVFELKYPDGTFLEPPSYCWAWLDKVPENHTTVLIKYRYEFIPVGGVRTPTSTTTKTTTSIGLVSGRVTSTTTITSGVVTSSIAEPKSCDLKKVIWASSEADIGETIVIGVAALNCNNELINFFVREADTFGGDDLVRINPESARIKDDIAVSVWEAEWQTDCNGFCNPPEYYVIAQQASNPGNIIFSSTNLKVNRRIQAESEPELELPPLPPQKDIVIA